MTGLPIVLGNDRSPRELYPSGGRGLAHPRRQIA
jgi:hypothetical protein